MTVFDKKIAVTAAFLTALTIALGAFGAHGLKNLVDSQAINTFETGVRYQMYHSIGLLILGAMTAIPLKTKKTIFWLFIVGMVFFSGSIYLLSLNAILPFDAGKIGFITPIGGLLFIIGWVWWGYAMLKLKNK